MVYQAYSMRVVGDSKQFACQGLKRYKNDLDEQLDQVRRLTDSQSTVLFSGPRWGG